MRRKAVYGGSFDPLTNGHMFMIREGARLFDELVVAIGVNAEKRYTLPLADRLALLRECVRGMRNVKVDSFENRYLVEYAGSIGAKYMLRGLRIESDFAYERTMRNVNADMDGGIVTVFLMPPRELADVSSSFVKGLVGPNGWDRVVSRFVPAPVLRSMRRRFDLESRP
ncbi:MAG: pantetheine-phosphate adenylyltransferase [Planctomycetota bacterium]